MGCFVEKLEWEEHRRLEFHALCASRVGAARFVVPFHGCVESIKQNRRRRVALSSLTDGRGQDQHKCYTPQC